MYTYIVCIYTDREADRYIHAYIHMTVSVRVILQVRAGLSSKTSLQYARVGGQPRLPSSTVPSFFAHIRTSRQEPVVGACNVRPLSSQGWHQPPQTVCLMHPDAMLERSVTGFRHSVHVRKSQAAIAALGGLRRLDLGASRSPNAQCGARCNDCFIRADAIVHIVRMP